MVYGAMNRRDWRTVSLDDMSFDPMELSTQLIPALRAGALQDVQPGTYGERLIEECRTALSALIPFNDTENRFLDLLLECGEVVPDLLTKDVGLQERIRAQPLLEWKVLNVRRHLGLA